MIALSTLLFALICLASCKANRPPKKPVSNPEKNQDTLVEAPHSVKHEIDTLNYVQRIKSNKEKYKNKEPGALLRDLKIEVKSYGILVTRIGEYNGLMLFFDDLKTTHLKIGGRRRFKEGRYFGY